MCLGFKAEDASGAIRYVASPGYQGEIDLAISFIPVDCSWFPELSSSMRRLTLDEPAVMAAIPAVTCSGFPKRPSENSGLFSLRTAL